MVDDWQWYDMIHVDTEEIDHLCKQDIMWRIEYTMDTAARTQEVKYPASMKDLLK